MTTTQSADLYGFRKLTKKVLLESCKKNKLYRTPALNDVLYLHYQGYEDIESLEEYTGLKCIWLECNAISKISGLDNQKLLKCLFLHNNVIKKIENLEYCPELDTINLSHNHIIKIENCGIDKLPVLTSLNLSHNYLKSYDSLINLVDCKMLSVLDIANNRIDDILCVKIFAQMPELRVLVLQGNPVVNQIPQYRKTLILDCLNLTYLDSRPVFPRDRACAEAWKQGGYEAERIEHARWNREERKKIRQSVNATLRLKNRGGGDPQPQLLMSSDDEDAGITELSSAPSLEKDQMNKVGSSSQALKSSDEDEDSDEEYPCSIPLFKMNTDDNTQTPSLFNAEQRCIVCSRPNCNDEHKKKRKRIRNLEEPETILENTFIFNLEVECNQETMINDDEENKLYKDVYRKNIQYINESVSACELKNETEDKNFNINISRQETVDIAELSSSGGNPELSIGAFNTTELSIENVKANTPHNLSQLLVRYHDEDSDITELSSAPPMKKCKLNEQGDSPFNTDESLLDCSQYKLSDEHIKIIKQERGTEDIFENSSNSNSGVVNLDIVENNSFTETNILYNNIYKTNTEYISEIVEKEVIAKTIESILRTGYIERNNPFLSDTDITNIETCDSVSYIQSENKLYHEQPDAENVEISNIDIETNNNSVFDMISKNELKHDPVVESNNKITDNIKIIKDESLLQNVNVTDQPLIDNCTLKLYLNTLPAVFSSRLYLGTDTKINSAIALYEMSHRKEYNSDSESDEIETSIKTTRNKFTKSKVSITNSNNIESKNLEPKMEIINRLLNNPITRTFKYDSFKINEEFKKLKDNDSTTLNEFIESQNINIEINNQSDSLCETKEIGIYVSKSEEIILQKNSDTDDESKIETHSSDTRISKINY